MVLRRLPEYQPPAATDFEKAEEEALENDATEDEGSAVTGDELVSDSDTQSDITQTSLSSSAFKIQSFVSIAIGDSSKPEKSSPTKRSLNPTVIAGSKRTSERDIKTEDSKKKRKKKEASNGNNEDAKKGSGAQRLWNVDGGVGFLKGIVECKSKKGVGSFYYIGMFHEFFTETEKLLQYEARTKEMKDALSFMRVTEARKLEGKWKDIYKEEVRLAKRKADFLKKILKLRLKAMASS